MSFHNKAANGKNRTKQSNRTILVAILLALVPVAAGLIRCAIDGKTLADIYLPSSQWNDELFYYKLTEGVVHYGFPQGYFGFNESHGLYLSFAACSPILLLFWALWGILFGWNLLSPILCNIALMAAGMFALGMTMKPGKRTVAWIIALFAAFTPVTRYMLSGMPEIECFMLLLLFFTTAYAAGKRAKTTWLIGMTFALAMLLTWMRPYYILLFLTPVWIWKKHASWKKVLPVSGLLFLLTAAVYYAVNHFLSAPYLTDLFYTDWITAFFTQGFAGGMKYMIWKLYTSLVSVLGMIIEATAGAGLASGALYLAFYLLQLLWLISIIRTILKRREGESLPLVLQIQMLLCMAGFGTADLLMYRLTEGSKHTAAFILVSLLLLPYMNLRGLGKTSDSRKHGKVEYSLIASVIVLCYLFVYKADIPYDYAIPYRDATRSAQLETLKNQLQENMTLTENAPSYDNTVIWSLWDQVNGETVTTDFGAYYMIPQGFGINLCDGGFMAARPQLDGLQSRYIATTPGGDIEKACKENGGRLVGSCSTLVVYDMKKS